MRMLLSGQGYAPRLVVTDKLGSVDPGTRAGYEAFLSQRGMCKDSRRYTIRSTIFITFLAINLTLLVIVSCGVPLPTWGEKLHA